VARVPLLESSTDPRTQALIERLKSGRRGSLLGIYKALLHNGRLAETWFEHLNAVRWETELTGRLREILIIRIGWRLHSAYILRQHIPKLAEPEGLDADDCQALQREDPGDRFTPAELNAIALADELTGLASATQETVEKTRADYSDKALVEIVVLIGTYNMHARFVAALDIDLEP
jgi:alkylhydroperoxidase family enzyme